MFANVVQSVPVVASLNAADAILTLAGLSFLGIGMDPSAAAEWGYDVSRGVADAQAGFWWTGLFPGIAIILLVTGLTLVGEGLNDTLNPVLRRPNFRKAVLSPNEGTVAAPAAPMLPVAAAARATAAAASPGPVTEPVIAVSGLRVWYGTERGPVKAVDGVSFEVAAGRDAWGSSANPAAARPPSAEGCSASSPRVRVATARSASAAATSWLRPRARCGPCEAPRSGSYSRSR